ncbi:F-box/kelch-repeat protein [Panicum miliaceum]|uniref:F-box/kelch-repeat protein n=1 Tax=Panicum miliaceum TaxID=4540 RepID=A0A3L6RFE3_PANMI|nr:F-box/kelch-repeat protein [Panicum miliaceum]
MGTGDGAGGSEGRGRGTICRTPGRGNKRLTDLHYSSVQLQVRLVFLLARECLVQLGFNQLPAARRVSRGWKAKVESPFHHRLHCPRPLLGSRKYAASAAAAGYSYPLVLHDPATGTRTPLPALPDGGGPPLFSQLVAV